MTAQVLGRNSEDADASASCKVSVIVPVFNMEATLPETLDSVLRNAEALGDVEIIVVDDGSTDASFRVGCVYAERHPAIRMYSQPNQGSGPARNLGLSAARGEYVAFMDAGDFYPEDTTLAMLYRTAREKDVDICGGSILVLREDGSQVEDLPDSCRKFVFRQDGRVAYRDHQFPFGYQGFIYRRDWLLGHGLRFPDSSSFQDPPFFVKAMDTAQEFYAVREVVYVCHWRTKEPHWTEREALDLLQGIFDVLRIAKERQYADLYYVIYLDYLHYKEALVGVLAQSGNPGKLFHAWIALVKDLDAGILGTHGVDSGALSVRCLVECVYPYIDVAGIIHQIKEGKADVRNGG